MDFKKFLLDNHKTISDQWFQSIVGTYQEEGAKFFGGSSNQFANPAGHTFRVNIEKMYLALVKEWSVDTCSKDLDGILRIRAVQGFSPSVALSFLPALKEIVYRELLKGGQVEAAGAILHDWNNLIDRLTMLGFDLYVTCRETLWQQKANQLYSRTHKLLEKANLIRNVDEEVAG